MWIVATCSFTESYYSSISISQIGIGIVDLILTISTFKQMDLNNYNS